jgi:hypothetical protein
MKNIADLYFECTWIDRVWFNRISLQKMYKLYTLILRLLPQASFQSLLPFPNNEQEFNLRSSSVFTLTTNFHPVKHALVCNKVKIVATDKLHVKYFFLIDPE